MDNKKDNQLALLRGLNVGVEFNVNMVGLFGDNYACAHAYKKTEKLLMAIHLVTNFVSETEPARNAIRDKSVRILSEMLKLRFGFGSAGSSQVDNVVASLYEIISILNVLHIAGFISGMNLEILKKELLGLIVFLQEAEESETSEKITFEKNDFKTEEFLDDLNLKDKKLSLKDGFLKRTSLRGKTHGDEKRKNIVAGSGSVSSVAHADRRNIIINLIKDKISVNVKDISIVIKDCSEKTIQRELIALVNEGVLKKEGERRWSVYSLK